MTFALFFGRRMQNKKKKKKDQTKPNQTKGVFYLYISTKIGTKKLHEAKERRTRWDVQ
jgi:hypothetical protein